MTRSNSFSNGNSAYNGNSESGGSPAARNPYLGDERLVAIHWWYFV